MPKLTIDEFVGIYAPEGISNRLEALPLAGGGADTEPLGAAFEGIDLARAADASWL